MRKRDLIFRIFAVRGLLREAPGTSGHPACPNAWKSPHECRQDARRSTLRIPCRVALAVGVALVGYTTLAMGAGTHAATPSTWSRQPPRPRSYLLLAIACPSVTTCIAVGTYGLVVTTDDGGQHWVRRSSGTTKDLASVTCPGPGTCYALGLGYFVPRPTPRFVSALIRSTDGGHTWQEATSQLPTSRTEWPASLACPSPRICLVSGYDAHTGGSAPVLRTADSGRTWQAVHIPRLHGYVAVTCATVTVCYAGVSLNGKSGLARSDDRGKTWTVQGLTAPPGLTRPMFKNRTMACPAATTCYATALDCGSFACNVGGIFVTRDGGQIWKHLHDDTIGGIVCPRATTCYANATRSVLSTSNSGQTWSEHRLPNPQVDVACPSPTTCYTVTSTGVLKTSDGFSHIRQTLACHVSCGQSLTDTRRSPSEGRQRMSR